MRKTLLTAAAGALLAVVLGASPGAAQVGQPKKAFAHYIDMWMMRAAMLRICNKEATARKVETIASSFLSKGVGWDLSRSQKQTTRIVTGYVTLFNGWLNSSDATRQAVARQLFSPASCKHLNVVSRFEVGFLRGRLKKMQ